MDGRSDPLDLLLEVISPVVRQRRDSRDAPEPIQIVLIADIEPRDLRDRYTVRGPLRRRTTGLPPGPCLR